MLSGASRLARPGVQKIQVRTNGLGRRRHDLHCGWCCLTSRILILGRSMTSTARMRACSSLRAEINENTIYDNTPRSTPPGPDIQTRQTRSKRSGRWMRGGYGGKRASPDLVRPVKFPRSPAPGAGYGLGWPSQLHSDGCRRAKDRRQKRNPQILRIREHSPRSHRLNGWAASRSARSRCSS